MSVPAAKHSAPTKHRIVGVGPWGVVEPSGAMLYDLIEDRQEAEDICAIVNDGIGPEWDDVEPELLRRRALGEDSKL